jgi:hypothetical protein
MTEQTTITAQPEQPTATVTPIKPKRPSAATKKAAATQKGASKPAPKQAPKATAKKDEEITVNMQKAIVAEALIRAAGELAKGWSDKRVPKAFAAEMLASYVSYTPGNFWVAGLPVPTTGRGSRHTLQ